MFPSVISPILVQHICSPAACPHAHMLPKPNNLDPILTLTPPFFRDEYRTTYSCRAPRTTHASHRARPRTCLHFPAALVRPCTSCSARNITTRRAILFPLPLLVRLDSRSRSRTYGGTLRSRSWTRQKTVLATHTIHSPRLLTANAKDQLIISPPSSLLSPHYAPAPSWKLLLLHPHGDAHPA